MFDISSAQNTFEKKNFDSRGMQAQCQRAANQIVARLVYVVRQLALLDNDQMIFHKISTTGDDITYSKIMISKIIVKNYLEEKGVFEDLL